MNFDFKCGYGVIILLAVLVAVFAVDQDSRTQLSSAFKTKPYGPFYCRARCVAECLKMNLAANISECAQERCTDFDENTPCASTDETCWQNCGNEPSSDDPQAPSPINEITADFDIMNNVIDPYKVKIEWAPENGVNLYIVEVSPMENGFDWKGTKVVRTMTTLTYYILQKPDLCGSFMARVMLVTKYGLSIPHYKRINEWSPPDDANLQLYVKSIYRPMLDVVRVEIHYTNPETWQDDDVVISDFVVRAYDCTGMISDGLFSNSKPDENGFYFPYVYTNTTQSSTVELSFAPDIMYAQCKFTYKVLALYSRCEVETVFDIKNKYNEVDFAINCGTVENANCGTSQPSSSPHVQSSGDPTIVPIDESIDDERPEFAHKLKQTDDDDMATTPPPAPWGAQVSNNETVASFEDLFEKENQRLDDQLTSPDTIPLPPAPASESEEKYKNITSTDDQDVIVPVELGTAENPNVEQPRPLIVKDIISPTPEYMIVEQARPSKGERFEVAAFYRLLVGSLFLVIVVSIIMVSLLVWYTNKRNQKRRDEHLIKV